MKMSNKKYESGLVRILKKTVKNQKLLTFSLMISIMGAVILALLPPLILEKIVDHLTLSKEISLSLAILYFMILILSAFFEAIKELFITIFGQKITHGLRSEMCRKLSVLPASYFTKYGAGMVTSRFVNDVDTIEDLFTDGIISMCVDICKVISIAIIIFTKSIGLGIMLLIIVPVLFVLTRVFQKKMLKAQKDNRVAIGKVNNFIPETIQNIRTIHCLKKEKYMEKKYDEKILESYHAIEKSNLYDSLYSPIVIMISTILIAIVMLLSATGGEFRLFFGMSAGTAVAVISFIGKVFEPVENIGMEIQNIQSAFAGIDRIKEFLAEEEIEKPVQIEFDELMNQKQNGILFEDVAFSYEDGKVVLNELDFRVDFGEMVTIAGRTGAGKSTIFKLLLGLYTPQKGRIMLFGMNANEIPNEIKRRLFGYVEQNFKSVPGTIKQQITLFDEMISTEQVIEAATLVGIHQSIMKLENGYDTPFSNELFSKGQIQLLSIARAIVMNPPVMLLDEITANLDSITERSVLEAIERAVDGRTVISISHRLYENMGNRLIEI